MRTKIGATWNRGFSRRPPVDSAPIAVTKIAALAIVLSLVACAAISWVALAPGAARLVVLGTS